MKRKNTIVPLCTHFVSFLQRDHTKVQDNARVVADVGIMYLHSTTSFRDVFLMFDFTFAGGVFFTVHLHFLMYEMYFIVMHLADVFLQTVFILYMTFLICT